MDISNLKNQALNHKKEFKNLGAKLKKINPNKIDKIFNELHNEQFDNLDCLDCANCCKALGPRLRDADIERLSKFIRIKPSEFVEKYLIIDEDKDYVFKSMPCPFLLNDNFCEVYSKRPKACKDYPHTKDKNIKGNIKMHIKNTETCPAVFNIFKQLLDKYV